MVNIPLSENWRIKSDKYGYMLVREQNSREFVEGYYSNIENCINGYLERKIRLSNASSIFSLVQYQKQLVTALNKVLQPLKIEVKISSEMENETNDKSS